MDMDIHEAKVKELLDKNEAVLEPIQKHVTALIDECVSALEQTGIIPDNMTKEQGDELLKRNILAHCILISFAQSYKSLLQGIEMAEDEADKTMDKICKKFGISPLHKKLAGQREKKWWQF